jgi:predicted RNA-binding protein with PUA-like domain
MNHWLMKSEPEAWSWNDQVKAGTAEWDGVRNHQAANFMKEMRIGDQALFYHSGKERRIVGLCEVARSYYPDPTDASARFGMVDVKAVQPVPTPVTLAAIKADPRLADFLLVRQSRLSVMPVTPVQWRILAAMAGLDG